MLRSLYSGVSGMKSNQTKMDVIGNNIANVNTTAFKSGRVTFKDMLSQSVNEATAPQDGKGGLNPKQIGIGVGVASIDTNMSQGALQPTGRATDLAIEGNGFFVVSDGTEFRYTRDGSLTIDKNGNLLSADGYHIKGLKINAQDNSITKDNVLIIGNPNSKSNFSLAGKQLTDLDNLIIPMEAKINNPFYQLNSLTNFAGFGIQFSQGNELDGWTIKTGQVGDGTATSVTLDDKSKTITINGDFSSALKNIVGSFNPVNNTGLTGTDIGDTDLGSGLSPQNYRVVVDSTIAASVKADSANSSSGIVDRVNVMDDHYLGEQDELGVKFRISQVADGKVTAAKYSTDNGATWQDANVDASGADSFITYNGAKLKIDTNVDNVEGQIISVDFFARYNILKLQDSAGADIQGNIIKSFNPGVTGIMPGSISGGLGSGLSASNYNIVTTKVPASVALKADATAGKVTLDSTAQFTGGRDELGVQFKIKDVAGGYATAVDYSNDGGNTWFAAQVNPDHSITYEGAKFSIGQSTNNKYGQTFSIDFAARYNTFSLLDASNKPIGVQNVRAYPNNSNIVIGDEATKQTIKINSSGFGDYEAGTAIVEVDKTTPTTKAYPKDKSIVIGNPGTGETVRINSSSFGDLKTGYETLSVGTKEVGIIESQELEKEINNALKNANMSQTIKVTGNAINGTTSAGQKLSLVKESDTLSVGGLNFKFTEGSELNGWAVKVGNANDGTPPSAQLDAANKMIVINGDFDNITAPGMVFAKDIESKINDALSSAGIKQTVSVSGNPKSGTTSGQVSGTFGMGNEISTKLTSFGVDKDGTLNAVYGDQTISIGKIALATFQNAAGLMKTGGNTYVQSVNSGNAVIGDAASQGFGNIQQGNLEMSNVDLASEFTDMIVTSRAYQANSRTIQTSDEMLQELLNLKR